jgi:hypothetical protein
MFTAALLIPILIEIVAGALSAVVVGNLVQPLSFGVWKNALIGAVGGVVFTWLMARTPSVEQFVEGDGSLSYELMVGVGAAGLIGGALIVTVAGLLRNRAMG